MHEAGWNLILYYELLPEDKIQYLDSLNKTNRKIEIGKIMRDDKKFSLKLTESFGAMRKLFIEANRLEDDDILSIKKDAIFVISKRCHDMKFKNVEFVEKNVYTSYHKFGKLELYYSSKRDVLDVKGINDNALVNHTHFMNILKKMFNLIECDNYDGFSKLMCKFSDDYKSKRLSYEYYREFNANSSYTITNSKSSVREYVVGLDGMDQSLENKLDISYNYLNFILPMIQRFQFNGLKHRK